jgi:vacuolar-type H+-ATPase subunit D/Vma8
MVWHKGKGTSIFKLLLPPSSLEKVKFLTSHIQWSRLYCKSLALRMTMSEVKGKNGRETHNSLPHCSTAKTMTTPSYICTYISAAITLHIHVQSNYVLNVTGTGMLSTMWEDNEQDRHLPYKYGDSSVYVDITQHKLISLLTHITEIQTVATTTHCCFTRLH